MKGLDSVVIAVDGPSGAGKSSVSKAVAERLGIAYIDTGAMYRAVALKAKRMAVSVDDAQALEDLTRTCKINFEKVGADNLTILNGEDVSDSIRTPEISLLTSKVSSVPGVRRALVELQRAMGREGGVIMDGRDVATVIFPETPFKFFVDASLEVRAKRRHLELVEKGGGAVVVVDESSTLKDMEERDRADCNREESPLIRTKDAIYIDTSDMSQQEVAAKIECLVYEIMKKEGKS